MEEWKEYKIGDICSKVCSGGTPSSKHSEYYDGDIPWLNTKEINFNRIYSTEKRITEEGLNNSSAKWIEENSVIIAMYGATAGKTAITKIPLTTNQACCNLTINPTVADYRYVYYFLCHKFVELASLANGGAQQNLNAQIIKDFEISLPSLQEQNQIANVLSALDDKIEVNRRINDNLEQQAQALFKSWFVDFEPFRDQPFVESELGMIPKGWRVGTLSEVANITMGASPSGSSYNVNGEGTVFYQGRAEFGYRFPHRNMFTTEPKRYAEEGEVLLSVRAPVGDINIANERCCIGRGLAAIGSKCYPSYILYLVKSLKSVFEQYNGEGTVFGSINKKTLEGLRIIVPETRYIERFEEIANPLDSQIRCKEEESRLLAELRDTLLPRLMSGEIKVGDVTL